MWTLENIIRPELIMFADVGSEKPKTYEYIPIAQDWCKRNDFPEIVIVKYEPKTAPYSTIEGNMVMNATLPGATFNWGSCTAKFKIVPQNKYASMFTPVVKTWARGERVAKLIGFEAAEEYRRDRASDKAHEDPKDAERYEYFHPLIEWGWTLKRCLDEIQNEGLPLPINSWTSAGF